MVPELVQAYIKSFAMSSLDIQKVYAGLWRELRSQLTEGQFKMLQFDDFHGTLIVRNDSDSVIVWVLPLSHKQTTIYYTDKNRSLEAYIKGEAKLHVVFNSNENGEYANLAKELIASYLFLSEF